MPSPPLLVLPHSPFVLAPEEGGVHEADMAEPEGAEPTAEEYNAFFDAIMAMP